MPRKDLDEWFWQVDARLQRISDALAGAGPLNTRSRCWAPRVDLIECPDRFGLRVELAGIKQEEVEVLYIPDRHSILIRGTRSQESCDDQTSVTQSGVHVLEIFYGEFEREIELPETPVEAESLRTSMANGLLLVEIPKARVRATHTRITIRRV